MNHFVYKRYAIDSFPHHFATIKAVNIYNAKIAKWCRVLDDSARDLTVPQKIKRYFFILYLERMDFRWWKESSNGLL